MGTGLALMIFSGFLLAFIQANRFRTKNHFKLFSPILKKECQTLKYALIFFTLGIILLFLGGYIETIR